MGGRLRLVALAAVAFAWPGPTLAHGEGEPWLTVPADRVQQGEPFTVIGADMGPVVQVALDLTSHGEMTQLGEVTTAVDGHFEATLVVPPSLRDGYAELRAVDSGGLEASTWLLVGDSIDPAVVAPPVGGRQEWWADPSVIILGLFVVGAAAALLYLLLRSRRAVGSPVPARARPMPRKGPARRARRSR